MRFEYSDGGRSKYFRAKDVGDCATRAICNATGKDYKEVYDAINALAKKERTGKRKRGISNARKGVYKATGHKYLESIGWKWHPTMAIGGGCTVHPEDFFGKKGTFILQLSKHLTCVRDGVLVDTYDCSRNPYTGKPRCVYGYWAEEAGK